MIYGRTDAETATWRCLLHVRQFMWSMTGNTQNRCPITVMFTTTNRHTSSRIHRCWNSWNQMPDNHTRSQAVARIADPTASQHRWGHVTSSITGPFDNHISFPVGGPLKRNPCLQSFSRYCALSVLASRVWPFKVTWRHRSRNHSIAHMPFPIGGPLEPSLYL